MDQSTQPVMKLYRSRNERMLAGVCGGMAEYFHTDPSWVRLVFVLFFFFGGCALLIYLILWLIVPLQPAITVLPAKRRKSVKSSS